MGSQASRDNNDMVDGLVQNGHITSHSVEKVFRIVDRRRFFPDFSKDEAYKDAPYKVPGTSTPDSQHLHISAPSMYATVFENLDLKTGMNFLNIGSGTGWLNTTAGFLIGSSGINHGMEIHENLVDYSYKRLHETLNSPEVLAFDWCRPCFFLGNGLVEASESTMYDRIYCGAAIPATAYCSNIVKLLKIGGVLIAPHRGHLMKFHRIGEEHMEVSAIMDCTFANLIVPSELHLQHVLPAISRPSLSSSCRRRIREAIRTKTYSSQTVYIKSLRPETSSTGPSTSPSEPDENTPPSAITIRDDDDSTLSGIFRHGPASIVLHTRILDAAEVNQQLLNDRDEPPNVENIAILVPIDFDEDEPDIDFFPDEGMPGLLDVDGLHEAVRRGRDPFARFVEELLTPTVQDAAARAQQVDDEASPSSMDAPDLAVHGVMGSSQLERENSASAADARNRKRSGSQMDETEKKVHRAEQDSDAKQRATLGAFRDRYLNFLRSLPLPNKEKCLVNYGQDL